jgi:DNA-binding Lrp family transcriptional regulator
MVFRYLHRPHRPRELAEDAATTITFEDAVVGMPEIRHAERLFGDPDYLLRVATSDLPAYATLRDEKLATLPGVQRLTSAIVMKRVVDNRPLPIPRARRSSAPPS